MRSDRHDRGKPYKKIGKNTMSEDFLAEFRNMEEQNSYSDHSSYDYNSYDSLNEDEYKRRPKQNSKAKKNNVKSKQKKKKPKKKKRKVWPKVFVILLLLLATGVAGAYFFLDSQVDKFDFVETSKKDFAIDKDVAKNLKGYRNIAVLGIDARAGEDPKNCRTDAIIIVTINNKTGGITMTSIMRDSYMLMDDRSGNSILDKATHAHAFGGPINTVKMLNQSLDLDIDEFVVMDWDSVADTVDAMGGITVDVKANELRDLNKWGPETARNTNRKWKPITDTGKQKIDGAQAATYCRIRKTSGGDPGRTNRMKKVMTALLVEAKKHPGNITKMTDKVLPEIRTNMTTSDFMSILPKVVGLKIEKSIGYPFNYWGGILNGKWLAVPTTLENNVKILHKKLFNQADYEPSNRAKEISQKIIYQSGISQGNDINE